VKLSKEREATETQPLSVRPQMLYTGILVASSSAELALVRCRWRAPTTARCDISYQ